jgi:hypothetical protein
MEQPAEKAAIATQAESLLQSARISGKLDAKGTGDERASVVADRRDGGADGSLNRKTSAVEEDDDIDDDVAMSFPQRVRSRSLP